MNLLEKSKEIYNKILDYCKKCKTHILFSVIFLLLFLLFVVWRKPVVKTVLVTQQNKEMIHQVKILQDRNKKDWAELKQYVIDVKRAKELNDSLAYALRIKPKFIKGRDVVITKSDTLFTELPTQIVYLEKDTVYKAIKKDSYIDIEANVGRNFSQIKFATTDTITRVVVIKTPWIGKTTTSVYLSNKNPYNRITEGMSFVIKEKKPILNIGPYVGINYDKKFSAGISLQYPLFTIKK